MTAKSGMLGAMMGVIVAGSVGTVAAQERLALPEEYLLIAGGWYLNARCDFLDDQRFSQFRANLLRLDEIARSALDKSYVAMLRETAREAAYAPLRAACGDDEKAVVTESAAMAQSFAVASDGEAPVLAANEPLPEA